MAVPSRGRTEVQMLRKWKDRAETSPERTMVWTEPKPKPKMEKKVPVVYYLSKDGHLEHPHFIEVPLSSSDGLYLRDVINRLNSLRGKGMASMYSWSSKRSYKNGFVWHDLTENDFIYPAHGQEYVLKGSEFFESNASFRSQETESPSSEKLPGTQKSGETNEYPVVVQRRNQSWSSIDLHEYKVYKTESTGEYAGKAADAATQTDEKRRRRRMIREEEDEEEEEEKTPAFDEEQYENHTTELSRDEISPPPSSSSPETLESLIKADGRISSSSSSIINDPDIRNLTANNHPSGRVKASVVLKQLISCGSFTVKDGGSESSRRDQGFSFISHYRARLPHESSYHVGPSKEDSSSSSAMENPSFGEIGLEDKEYFSGSLMETKNEEFETFKRSSSCNADRSSKLELENKDTADVQKEYVQRSKKPAKTSMKKEVENNVSRTPLHGSKRLTYDPIR